VRNVCKYFAVDEGIENELRKQSRDFCAAGFDEVGKPWGKCINVGGGYVEK
jgi:hypothetical protein